MKSFTIKALAVAAASVCGSAAFAGTATVPAGVTTYAVEALTSTTAVTLPALSYKMGVARTSAQDFTVVIKPVGGSTFDGTVCNSAKPATVAAAAVNDITVSLKRASSTECAYEVDITNAAGSDTNLVMNFTGLKLTAHSLASGGTEKVTVGLWDLGETARIDNSADLTVTVANAGQAVTILSGTDTGTTANVDDTNGPLFGFVAQNNDSATTAAAAFVVSNNPNGYKIADGVTAYDLANVNHATKVSVTMTGDFDGATLTNGAVTGVSVAPMNGAAAVTVTGTTSAKFDLLPANFNASTVNQVVNVSFVASGAKSLGTARFFGVSAVVDSVVGADETVANSNFWTWDANAIELRSAFFNNADDFVRFFFQNVGSAAGYSATCQAEAGQTVTYGTAKTGTLINGMTMVLAKDICSFSGGKRGAITFVINAPAKNVKGVFQQAVNGLSAGYIPLERPYAGKTY
ncbi:hypothetical protein ACS5PK_19660 [Roseateles sp. DB2]|uniref:hypothetical protein n=1 Tax=Roseateles sp. DB2 TaxID=3453717 RepID=UPI003EEADA49